MILNMLIQSLHGIVKEGIFLPCSDTRLQRHTSTLFPKYTCKCHMIITTDMEMATPNVKVVHMEKKKSPNSTKFSAKGVNNSTNLPVSCINTYMYIPGGPQKTEQSIQSSFQDFALTNSYLFSPCWIEHLFLIMITPRSSNLVENFSFHE